MEKRLTRAKKVLSGTRALFELGDARLRDAAHRRPASASTCCSTRATTARLPTRRCVLDLCREAMRLVALLVEHAHAATPATQALAALMALARGPTPCAGRRGRDLTELSRQDRSRWDGRLIAARTRAPRRPRPATTSVSSTTSRRRSPRTPWLRAPQETPWAGHRRAVRRAPPHPAVAGGRAEPGDGGREALGPERGWRRCGRSPAPSGWRRTRSTRRRLGELELADRPRGRGAQAPPGGVPPRPESRGADLPRPSSRGVRATTRLRASSASAVSATVGPCYTARRRWPPPSTTPPSPSGRRTSSPSPPWARRCSSPA